MMSAERVKAKLKNLTGTRSFDYLLRQYLIERILYRLSVSPYATKFILKGGLLLYTKLGDTARAILDIDFLARHVQNASDELSKIFAEIAAISVDDAVTFDTTPKSVKRIKEDADYQGVRVKLTAHLDRSRHVLQFDIGFGDVIILHPIEMTYPSLLDMEPPQLQAYSLESVIAEKSQSIVYLAEANSRMKDFYDIYELSRNFPFDGAILQEAIIKTLTNRDTAFESNPLVFSDAFPFLPDKQTQWQAFQLRMSIAKGDVFSAVVSAIKRFLSPLYGQYY